VSDQVKSADTILVYGAGAIGGTIAAYWARAGVPVLMVDVMEVHVERCRTEGMLIEGKNGGFTQVVPAVTPSELDGTFSRVVLAVKSQNTQRALNDMLPHLAADGFIVSAQNGLNELVIAQHVGESRTVGCYVGFGADWQGPGHIVYGGRGEVVVGEIDGTVRTRTNDMHRLLSIFEPDAKITRNVWGFLWSKLALAAILLATALDNEGMDVSIGRPERFPIFDGLAREVMAVAHARGITPEPFRNFDPAAFLPGTPQSSSRSAVQLLSRRWDNSDKKHSGFWRDLAVRKRPTEVDALMGPVLRLAAEDHIECPLIQKLVELVHDVERGGLSQCAATLELLLERSRAR